MRLDPALPGDRQRRHRLPPLRHLLADAAQVVAASSRERPCRSGEPQFPATPLARTQGVPAEGSPDPGPEPRPAARIKRLHNQLIRKHTLKLSTDTIHKVLAHHGERYLKRRPLRRKGTRRYSRLVPGDQAQVDFCKTAPKLYKYTAIDDCSRFQVIGLYPRRTAANTVHFLERVLEEMPFAIHRPATARSIQRRRRRAHKTSAGASRPIVVRRCSPTRAFQV